MRGQFLKILDKWFKRPLKIGMISYYYPTGPTTNGVAIHVYNLVRSLANLGVEVHLFTKGEKDKETKEKIGEGKLFIHFLKINLGLNLFDPVVSKRMDYNIFENRVFNAFVYENSKRKFDAIHTQG